MKLGQTLPALQEMVIIQQNKFLTLYYTTKLRIKLGVNILLFISFFNIFNRTLHYVVDRSDVGRTQLLGHFSKLR